MPEKQKETTHWNGIAMREWGIVPFFSKWLEGMNLAASSKWFASWV
jgi:hypothetical protein